MKKQLLILTLLSIAFTQVNAQVFSLGGNAGVNLQNITGKNANGDQLKNKLVPRYTVGLNLGIRLAPEFYLQPGVSFTTKGADSEDGNTKVNLSYVDIPVNFIFKPALGNSNLLLGFGPYLGLGVGGKEKTEVGNIVLDRKVTYEKTIDVLDLLSTSKAYYAPTEAGVNLLAGFEFASGFSFQINAQLGLTEINPSIRGVSTNKTSLKNTGFGISLGYRMKS